MRSKAFLLSSVALLKTPRGGLAGTLSRLVTFLSTENLPGQMVLPFPPIPGRQKAGITGPDKNNLLERTIREEKESNSNNITRYKTKKPESINQLFPTHHFSLPWKGEFISYSAPFRDVRWHRIGHCKRLTLPWPKRDTHPLHPSSPLPLLGMVSMSW